MAKPELEALAAEIQALTPPARLRLAADLMERRRGDVAYAILDRVHAELGAAIALRKIDEAKRRGGGG